MQLDAWEPHGRALRDYFAGARDAELRIHASDGAVEDSPLSIWFRGPSAYFAIDRAALELARGRVLDLGAGTGVHSLALEARGQEVVAVDRSAAAVEILRARGVRDARCIDISEPEAFATLECERFDTILVLANGAGLASSLEGLAPFLARVAQLLADGGAILIDSADVRGAVRAPSDGGYAGELEFRFEYRGFIGPPFAQLYVDAATLAERAARAGLATEIVSSSDAPSYLARLTKRSR